MGVLRTHPCGFVTASNTEWGANRSVSWMLDHSLQSTEALRHICMFSHCCINYGWNTDSVLLIYAWPTLPPVLLAISKIIDIFLPGQEKGSIYFCNERGWGVGGDGGIGWVHHCPQKWDSCFDTHTVDSKQPWTNGNSGFFSHSVFYFYGVKGNTNCNLKKGLQDNYFLGYVFRMPTCLEVSQDNVILMDSLLIAVYWIAL